MQGSEAFLISLWRFPLYETEAKLARKKIKNDRIERTNFMKRQSRWVVICTALLCIVSAGSAYGASDGSKVKVEGLITGRDGENLTVKTIKGSTTVVVVLTDTTKVQIPKGLLKLRHTDQAITALIPGFKINVEGTGTDTRVVANTIKLTKDDLRLAETIQAGLNPTEQQQQKNTANI